MSTDDEARLHFSAGNAAFRQEHYEDALVAFSRTVALAPNNAGVRFNRALTYRRLGRLEEAIAEYRFALSLQPGHAERHFNFGVFLVSLQRPQEALESLERAVALKPDWPQALVRLALTLRMLRRPAEAVAAFDRALALNPDDRVVRVQKATCELMDGRYEAGWRTYEARTRDDPHHPQFKFSQPIWRGETDIAGKTILVHSELGLGDTLQFCRYIPMLEAVGATVMFAPQPPLKDLMRSLSDSVQMVDAADPSLQFDVHGRLLSLPLAFETRLDSVPNSTPYLAAEPECVARWRQRLGSTGFKIGVCWQGSPAGQMLGLSFPPDSLAAIGAMENVRLISLQRGMDPAQPALAAAAGIEVPGDYFDLSANAFLDVAAMIEICDLVISTDSAILHLAGALNQTAWAPLHPNADWRWLADGTETPWYPSMRLFRTTRFDNLDETFRQMEGVLKSMPLQAA
jgi:tetratricopeptide (TPR) repeat protein